MEEYIRKVAIKHLDGGLIMVKIENIIGISS
jgi:hypothetical protein